MEHIDKYHHTHPQNQRIRRNRAHQSTRSSLITASQTYDRTPDQNSEETHEDAEGKKGSDSNEIYRSAFSHQKDYG